KPFGSFDPLRAQVHHFADIARRARGLHGRDRLRVFLRGPEWGHPPPPEVSRAAQRKHAVELTQREVRALAPALVVAVVTTFSLLWFQSSLALWERGALAVFVLG